MRRVLSYSAGYEPPDVTGGPAMAHVIACVVEGVVPRLGMVEVLKMCMDLGYEELATELLHRLWLSQRPS